MTERVRRMIEKVLERATASLEEIAEEAGVTYNTLYGWKAGRRNPTPENLAKLADALERRSTELAELAEKLRQEAER